MKRDTGWTEYLLQQTSGMKDVYSSGGLFVNISSVEWTHEVLLKFQDTMRHAYPRSVPECHTT